MERWSDIGTSYKKHITTRSLLGSIKDSELLKIDEVYEMPPHYGKSLIGHTGKLVSTSVAEHVWMMKDYDMRAAIADDTNHLNKGTKVLALVQG